jgi:hypothetical protein
MERVELARKRAMKKWQGPVGPLIALSSLPL